MGKLIKCIVVILVVCIFAPRLWHEFQDSRHSRSWPSVEGSLDEVRIKEVEQTERFKDGSSRTNYSYQLVARYSYRVGGVSYGGSRIKVGGKNYGTEQKALDAMREYQRTKEISVYYDPSNPSSSVLEPG
jgi:hypothetical protein